MERILHVYQRTLNGFNIFYDVEDYLVFFSIFAKVSEKYKIRIVGLCIMIDHLHYLIVADSEEEVCRFVSHFTSVFVKMYNEDVGRKGSLFESSFGRAWKKGPKKIRTSVAYVLNNPVEKGLCRRMEEYRWNFIAYATDSNPFSSRVRLRDSSKAFRNAVKEIDRVADSGSWLNFTQVRRLFSRLSEEDRKRLTDHIISCYNPIDYSYAVSHYGSIQNLILAVNSNTGSEYDIKEAFHHGSDVAYRELISYIRRRLNISPVRSVTTWTAEDKMSLAGHLHHHTSASISQISRFLHTVCQVKH